nr:hypothetical protein [Actinomycetota bacterium]
RVAVRRRLIAAVEERWSDGAVRAMAVSAERLGEDASFLKGLAETLYGQLAKRTPEEVRFDLPALEPVPRALRRRLLEQAVGRTRDRAGGIEAALDALDRPAPRPPVSFDVASGATIQITREDLVVRMPG